MNLKKVIVEPAGLEARVNKSWQIPQRIPPGVFRAYDIRGPVDGENITPELAYAIGLAVGSEARENNETSIIVGRDGRLSGPALHEALCDGLLATGLNIADIGVVPTPLVYYATFRFGIGAGVMITASHNPGNHNGFKIVLQGKTLTDIGYYRPLSANCRPSFCQRDKVPA